MDLPQASISYWTQKIQSDSELSVYLQQKERELQVGLRHVAHSLLTKLEQLAVNPEAKGLKDTAIALGILMDKMLPAEPKTVTNPTADRPGLVDMMQSPTETSSDTQS